MALLWRVIDLMKDLWRALFFICSIQFWRMALLWTFSVAYSHFQLLKDSLFSQKIVPYPRSSPSTFPTRPVCVITGVRNLSLNLYGCFDYDENNINLWFIYLLTYFAGYIWPWIINCMQTFQGWLCCCHW